MGTDHQHRICTYEEAERAIRARQTLYVSDCYCRMPAKLGQRPWPYCGHRTDVCMGLEKFDSEKESDWPITPIGQAEALERFEAWKDDGHLFRFMMDEAALCFCCACGCGWFRDEEGNQAPDPCDRSPFIESTDLSACTVCGRCVDVCAFGARRTSDGEMHVEREKCYGCGACEYACPEEAITMQARGT